MNFLAHAYLSFGDPGILAGNMLSDFIKGKKKFDYPTRIQQGIELHRAIDQFTDEHPVTAKAKQFFREKYGLYAAPFIDIVYDHFLAIDKRIFPDQELKTFSQKTYSQLEARQEFFPDEFGIVFHYMRLHDWLYNYQFQDGIFRSFTGLVRRAKYMNDPKPACDTFIKEYDNLKICYEDFFHELEKFTRNKL